MHTINDLKSIEWERAAVCFHSQGTVIYANREFIQCRRITIIRVHNDYLIIVLS